MQGFDIHIPYTATRNRLKTFCAPFLVLPLIIFLLCCVKPNMVNVLSDFSWYGVYSEAERTMFQTEQHIVQSLSQALSSERMTYTNPYEDLNRNTVDSTSSLSSLWFFSWYDHLESWGGKWLADLVLYIGCAFVYWLVIWFCIFYIIHCCLIFFPLIAFIIVRAKYPRWLFNWNCAVASYGLRILSYFLVLSPNFPDVEQAQGVELTLPEPKELAWYMPLFKWLLAIPHIILLDLMLLVVLPISFIGYCYAVIMAEYPQWIFDLVLRYLRWYYRVAAYSVVLCTDAYPSFF